MFHHHPSASTVAIFKNTDPASKALKTISHRAVNKLWPITIFFIACIASAVTLKFFFDRHLLLTYDDSYSHLLIARRIFDNATPGLAQLGGVWLPLPHLLLLPFVWNDYLWHTGLAGSFASMPCYIVASLYLFYAAYRITYNPLASFVGTLVFVLNPNVLYLQTTPLSEITFIATMLMACYHFLAWAQDGDLKQLVFSAIGTCLASLSRYDGWFLFFLLLGAVVVIGWARK